MRVPHFLLRLLTNGILCIHLRSYPRIDLEWARSLVPPEYNQLRYRCAMHLSARLARTEVQQTQELHSAELHTDGSALLTYTAE
jgi:hypothetical protein